MAKLAVGSGVEGPKPLTRAALIHVIDTYWRKLRTENGPLPTSTLATIAINLLRLYALEERPSSAVDLCVHMIDDLRGPDDAA